MISDEQIKKAIPHLFKGIDIPGLGEKHHGKVRDFYSKGDTLILITTDRQSAFDVNLGFVPYKGAVLNELTQFWLEQTRDIVDNHLLSVPDENVMVGKKCTPIPIEMVVRGYITGSTNTSIWYSYKQGERKIYGLDFPEGLKKNQKLPHAVITPTTKGSVSGHDERMTREQILSSGVVPQQIYKQMEEVTYALFNRGNEIAQKAGLIMPDTKYEYGMFNGKLTLMDELHTPDGSRFWIKDTYEGRFAKAEEPENFDKEFIRLWYTQRIDPYKDPIPPMPGDLMIAASRRYIDVYEKLTGKAFNAFDYPIENRILANLQKAGII
ncbi:MAG: phosphoribosylaminoimidazolesuccinocarboxamide synthase [Patescibacteria group bacterium]|nr:phosphoribosylaminoimidazolesuccinocarboxamide synthase [Patescibacteria group bacterium]MDE2588841.1 phosphoribosylaminoimidazolesuccinocarboxamide synthase [Patescibacteria group bacterium]